MSGWSPPWKDGQKRTVCSYGKIHCTGLAADSVFNGSGDFVGLYDERLDFSSLFFYSCSCAFFINIHPEFLKFSDFIYYYCCIIERYMIYFR